MSLATLADFLNPVNLAVISDDEGYRDTQLGKHVTVYETIFPDITHADLIIVGCEEYRGSGKFTVEEGSADAIRKNFIVYTIGIKTLALQISGI